MGTETERKFRVGDGWCEAVKGITGKRVEQAYLPPEWLKLTNEEGAGLVLLTSLEIHQQFNKRLAYLVSRDDIDALRELCQGEYSVRVRIKGGKKAYLTIKSANPGTTRAEFEYEIAVTDVQRIFDGRLYQGSIIDKMRYEVPYGDLTIEVDQFFGDNEGLVMAEVELPDENTAVNLPGWFGPEVTHLPQFYNDPLSKNPYKNWRDAA